MVVFLHPASRVLVAVSIIALQLLRESYLELSLATVMCVIPLHAANGLLANDVTEFGMSMMVKPVQLSYLQLFVYQLILIKTVEKRLCRFYRG